MEGDVYCFAHSPTAVEARRAARSAGGRARHGRTLARGNGQDQQPIDLATLTDVLGVLQDAVNDVLSLENSIARARTVGYLCSVWIRAFEASELEARLAALEAAYGEREAAA